MGEKKGQGRQADRHANRRAGKGGLDVKYNAVKMTGPSRPPSPVSPVSAAECHRPEPKTCKGREETDSASSVCVIWIGAFFFLVVFLFLFQGYSHFFVDVSWSLVVGSRVVSWHIVAGRQAGRTEQREEREQ